MPIVLFVLLLLVALPAHAAPEDFADWLQNLEQEAINEGISPQTVHEALDNVMVDDQVVELDHKQPETTATFESYVSRIVSPDRVEEARDMLEFNAATLRIVSQRYGVPPEIIVALWGIESRFGRNSGDREVIDSLVTLAYEGRRADFFRSQTKDALRILDQEHISSSALRGSWAGAMGQCQFMPSTYLKYAVDFDGKGMRDIWNNRADVFASIANYLAAEGWDRNMTWGREVELEEEVDPADIGLDHQKSLAEWSRDGVRNLDGSQLPVRDLNASLVQPDGPNGRSFLVYDNYRALMKWNRSTYFATAVGLLADRMK